MKLNIFLCVLGLGMSSILFGQDPIIFFENTSLLSNKDLGGPFCKAMTDINGDFRDDLVRVSNGNKIVVDIQSNNGEFLQNYIIDTIVGDSWTIAVADVNNDGFSDILSGGNYNGIKIYESASNPESIRKIYESEPSFFAQASNFVDLNNDGWLDAFVCDDDGHSEFFINDQQGSFLHDSTFINMVTVPSSNNSGNYGSVWTDIDGDGDIDCYIAKCRLGIDDNNAVSQDPRRVNALFINENGTYVEKAKEWGVDLGAQSWTANFGDIDNDGDQDLFVANHDYRSQLFENINNEFFQEIAFFDDQSEIFTMAYESAFADFNNDGYLDLLIVGSGDNLLINNKDNTFKRLTVPLGGNQTKSFALGDVNEDGFLDVLASYRPLGSGVLGERDKLWMSIPNDNNHLALSLVGYESNKSGVGAKVMIYGEWGRQTRFVKAGVSYGITNSLTTRFGIDNAEAIDSIVIEWPSGVKDVHSQVDINKHYIAHENLCLEMLSLLTADATRIDCMQSDISLQLNDSNAIGEWSTGETGNAISISEPGLYTVTVTSNGDCTNAAQSIIVRGPEVLQTPELNVDEDVVLCAGNNVEMTLRDFEETDWSNGDFSRGIEITETGVYFASNQNNCDTIKSDFININIIDPINPEPLESDFLLAGEQTIEVNESDVTWYSDQDGMNEIESGSILTTFVDTDTVFYFDYAVNQKPPIYVGAGNIQQSIDNPDFAFTNIDGALEFVVDETCLFKSLKVNANISGKRKLIITNKIPPIDTVFEKVVDLPIGVSTIDLEYLIENGSYVIRTDKDFNSVELGQIHPGFSVLSGDLPFPYRVADLARISKSLFGREDYHFFYDWKMQPIVEDCRSGITPYNLFYMPSSINGLDDEKIRFYPNPFNNIVNIKSEKIIEEITVFNVLNQKIQTVFPNDKTVILDLQNQLNGYYYIAIKGDGFEQVRRLLKIK